MKRLRSTSWLTKDTKVVDGWIKQLKEELKKLPSLKLIKPIQELKDLVETNTALNMMATGMFTQARILREKTPLGTPEVKNFDEFLVLMNLIMTKAPAYTVCPETNDPFNPCGLIGFPINALLDWPMATSSGMEFFSNNLVNQQFKKILNYWGEFLTTSNSRYVLVENDLNSTPKKIAWLSEQAKKHMVQVACEASVNIKDPDYDKELTKCCNTKFEDIFECNPSDEYYGFSCWDDFFTRKFKDDVRPVAQGENIIVNACESAPLQTVVGVKESDEFWLKGQPYSLENMMNFDPLYKNFIGGTVYQAFLSALSYHRWNSPVDGIVKKAFIVNGTYYLENQYCGFDSGSNADPSAPNDSQPFLSAVATRGVIFIESNNPIIGLMCFIAIGMAEVSSCEITVKEGDEVKKGDELGMFHFGGSTHCLVFGPQVDLIFDYHNNKEPNIDAVNIPVKSYLASVSKKDI